MERVIRNTRKIRNGHSRHSPPTVEACKTLTSVHQKAEQNGNHSSRRTLGVRLPQCRQRAVPFEDEAIQEGLKLLRDREGKSCLTSLTMFFDPLDHNGYLGDTYVVNGKAFPKFHVQRRKYRFRFLNGCNARHFELRLSSKQQFLGLVTDSWLYPQAFYRSTLLMSPAKRADVVIDFTNAPSELYLENILEQNAGRGPNGKLSDRDINIPGTQVLKFVVEGEKRPDSATVEEGTKLRPHIPISAEEVSTTRVFEFHHRKGAWQINQEFFDEFKANACPAVGSTERWILRNGSGGWWAPKEKP